MINKDTKLYGSFSNNPGNNGCIFFNNEFKKNNIDAIYKSFYSTDAKKLVESVRHLNFSGFAISMPLKVEIIKHLDIIDDVALKIGAVNTVINNNGILTGYNTDWLGVYNYIEPLLNYIGETVVILGNGGFSKAIQYSLDKLNIKYEIITRKDWNKITKLEYSITTVFNATPIDVFIKDVNLIDGRPFTITGKEIAELQAKEQFYLYTGIKI